jgi:hypothetical protein
LQWCLKYGNLPRIAFDYKGDLNIEYHPQFF